MDLVFLIYLCLVLIMFMFKGNTKRIVSKFYFGLSVMAVISMILLFVIGCIAVSGNNKLAEIFARIQIFITLEWISLLVHYFSISFIKTAEVCLEPPCPVLSRLRRRPLSLLVISALYLACIFLGAFAGCVHLQMSVFVQK